MSASIDVPDTLAAYANDFLASGNSGEPFATSMRSWSCSLIAPT